jgi:RHS repeat-associated protein
MGCLKLAYRSVAKIPIHRDSQKNEPVLRCVWNAGEQSKNRVRWYDYAARFYDPQIGRWTTIDPSAEERISFTPYNFCSNNSIQRIDSDGSLDDIVITGENSSSVTLKTDIINVTVDASSLWVDFGGNYALEGEEVVSAGLDIVGVFDPTGIADALNAGLQGSNGQWVGAIISGLGVIPYIGDLSKVGKIRKDGKIINNAIDAVKAKNLKEAAEKGIPKSQLGPSGKPKVHTVSRPNLKEAKDAARSNPKSNTSPVKYSSDKGQKTHYHSTRNGKKLTGKDNVHYENRSSKRNSE